MRVETDFSLMSDADNRNPLLSPTSPKVPSYLKPEQEIAMSTGCWLWDYLRRSGAAGYLVPLSGGIGRFIQLQDLAMLRLTLPDSCATAVTVYSMCCLVIKAIEEGNKQAIADCKRLAKYVDRLPTTAEELCNQLFHTIYLGMAKQSSKETRQRAKDLSKVISSYHVNLDIDEVYNAQRNLVIKHLEYEPKFKTEGGTLAESLMLQNIQARSRMVVLESVGLLHTC